MRFLLFGVFCSFLIFLGCSQPPDQETEEMESIVQLEEERESTL